MTQESARDREDVEQLGRRFQEFRSTHAARSRLPDELWAAAAKLARRDGIEVTARALDVDRPSLITLLQHFAAPLCARNTLPGLALASAAVDWNSDQRDELP